MKINFLKLNLLIVSIALISCSTETKNQEDSKNDSSSEMNHEEMADKAQQTNELSVPSGARVFFKNLQEGDLLNSPVKLDFGVEGMEVEPAGELHQGMGHHHLIIDGEFIPSGEVVPSDEQNIHFGKGQTETEVELSPGEHTLVMQFADGFHRSYGEQMSAKIVIVVN